MPKAEETRTSIIKKTAPVFNTKGFTGTTLSDMEKATGLTRGSIYNNFKNKDEVALAVFDYNLKSVDDLIKGEMSKVDSAKDQLMVYVKVYSRNILKYPFPVGGCPILNTAVDCDDTHPKLKKKARTAIVAWKEKLSSLLELGIKNKEFKKSIDTEQVALTLMATIEGAIMITRLTDNNQFHQAIMKSVEKMIQDLE